MTFNMLRNLLLACLLATSLYSAPTSDPKAPRAINFIAIACDQAIDGLYYSMNGKKVELHLPLYETIGPLAWGSEKGLKLFRKITATTSTPEHYQLECEINAPENSDLNILLFKTRPNGTLEIKVYGCGDDSFPLGQVRFVNFTSSILALKLNDLITTLKPEESKIVPTTNSYVRYAVAMQNSSGWNEVINGFGVVDDKNRLTVFVTDSQSTFFKKEVSPGIFLNQTTVNSFQIRH